eukprot:jgi/Mesvir1/20117/Mv13356-RA.1
MVLGVSAFSMPCASFLASPSPFSLFASRVNLSETQEIRARALLRSCTSRVTYIAARSLISPHSPSQAALMHEKATNSASRPRWPRARKADFRLSFSSPPRTQGATGSVLFPLSCEAESVRHPLNRGIQLLLQQPVTNRQIEIRHINGRECGVFCINSSSRASHIRPRQYLGVWPGEEETFPMPESADRIPLPGNSAYRVEVCRQNGFLHVLNCERYRNEMCFINSHVGIGPANCELVYGTVGGFPALRVRTTRRIERGDQLLMDFGNSIALREWGSNAPQPVLETDSESSDTESVPAGNDGGDDPDGGC